MEDYGDYYSTYPEKYNFDNFSKKQGRAPSPERRPRARRSSPTDRTPSRKEPQRQAARRPRAQAPKAEVKKTAPKPAPKRAQKPKPAPRHAATRASVPDKAQKTPMKRGKKALIALIVFVIVGSILAGAGIVGYGMYIDYKKNQPFRFSSGVKISGIEIGSLSYDEAKKKVKKESLSVVRDIKLKVTARDVKKTYTKKDFKYKFDYDKALKKAKVYSLKEQGIYESKKSKTSDPSKETEFTTMENPDFKLNYVIDNESIKDQVNKLALNVDREPENARVSKFHPFSDNRFEYENGKLGYTMDRDQLVSKIKKFYSSGKKTASVNAKVSTLQPSISVENLQENIVGLSTATSVSNNTAAGTHNMAVALKACNGSIIEPNELWSFNNCTGDSNDAKNGYKKATVISERKLDQGIGGGICQASTTIFQAGALANMDIIERHNHYWASGYACAGEDATIDYPSLDLRMRNITDYQMFMECKVEGTTLIVNIYGYQEPHYDNVKIRSENYDITDGQYFRTRTYRTLYKNHEVVSDEVICTSYYSLTENHAVRTEDKGTFRTKVNGVVIYEDEPEQEDSDEDSDDDSDEDSDSGEEEENEADDESEEDDEQAALDAAVQAAEEE